MAIQGLTNDAIRGQVLTLLRESAEVTGRVPAAAILESRIPPLTEALADACIIVYIHSDSYDFAGTGGAGSYDFPSFLVATELAIELFVRASDDSSVEGLLDIEQSILSCLLENPDWVKNWYRVAAIRSQRETDARGSKRAGMVRLILTLVHSRAWGA